MATEAAEAKVDLVPKEIKLTKLLALNDLHTRSDIIKQIKELLLKHSEDTTDAYQLNDYLIIWRGLFYFMWTSHKPVPQESVTEKISFLIHSCTSYQGKILFLDAFFLTIKDDWMSIRQRRIDKCIILMRHCLRQLLFTFVNCDWNLEYMNKFSEVLYRALKLFPFSLRTHLQLIFLEELAIVSRGKVPSEALVIILDSFLHYISELNNLMLIREVTQNVFKRFLCRSLDLKTLEAKFQGFQNMVNPGSSNDLGLVEGDIKNDDSNEIIDNPLDPQAGKISIEIPRIKFNPKDIEKVLNKYLTEIDCTRKCLLEIDKLTKFFNCLGDCILPYIPKDLEQNSQVLKQKKEKHLSKMVKEGVKRLKMDESRIKKNSLEVNDHKSLKKLNKMGEIVVERVKIGKSKWKVRHFDNVNILKENFNLNGSWTVSMDTKINGTNTVCINDNKPPLMAPAGFNVELTETPEKSLKKLQKKVTVIPNLKFLTVDSSLKESSLNKRKSKNQTTKMNDEAKIQNSFFIKVVTPNDLNTNHNNSLSISADHGESASKMIKNNIESKKAVQSINASHFNNKSLTPDNKIEKKNKVDDKPPLMVPAELNVHSSEIPEKILNKIQKKGTSTQKLNSLTVNSSLKELKKVDKIVVKGGKIRKSVWKVRNVDNVNTFKENFNLNGSWTVSKEIKIDGTNKMCVNDFKSPLIVPAGFNVEVLETPETTLTKIQNKVSSTPNLKSLKTESSLKELNKMGEIVVECRQIGKSMWKVRNVDNVNTLKENSNLNRSWKVSMETIIDGTKIVCINNNKPPFPEPAGINVEVSQTTGKISTKVQKNVSSNLNFKSLTVDSALKESNSIKPKSKSQISKSNDGSKKENHFFIKIGTLNALNTSHNNSLSISADRGGSVSKKIKNSVESAEAELSVNASHFSNKSLTPDYKIEEKNKVDDLLISKVKLYSDEISINSGLNDSWSKCDDKNVKLSKCKSSICNTVNKPNDKSIEKSNSSSDKICTSNIKNIIHNDGLSVYADNDGSASKKVKKNESSKIEKGISLTSVVTPDKCSETPMIPTSEQRVLRPRTIITPINKPHGQNESTPKLKVKEISATKVLQECRNTITPKKSSKIEKDISLTSVVTPDKCSETPMIPTSEQRVLRPRTIITSIYKPHGQNESTPKLKVKEISATKVLQECKNTITPKKSSEVEKGISLTSVITPDKGSENPKSPTFEQRVLRPRKIMIPMNKTDGQNESTHKRKLEETSANKVLQKRRKTIAEEEIRMLRPEEISNKALEKVRIAASEDGFGSLRKSLRLSIKIESAKKKLNINVEQECDFIPDMTDIPGIPPHKLPEALGNKLENNSIENAKRVRFLGDDEFKIGSGIDNYFEDKDDSLFINIESYIKSPTT